MSRSRYESGVCRVIVKVQRDVRKRSKAKGRTADAEGVNVVERSEELVHVELQVRAWDSRMLASDSAGR
jgi:hypothetical protein